MDADSELTWTRGEVLLEAVSASVSGAAKAAGLPQMREPSAGFDDGDWIWVWREFQHDEDVAADVRLRVSVVEVPEILHTLVVGLAWPVELEYRYLSRSSYRSSEDTKLAESRQAIRHSLELKLTDRLYTAWRATLVAADEVWHELVLARVAGAEFRDYPFQWASSRRESRNTKPGNHGKPWTPEDDRTLDRLINQNTPIRVIADELRRTEDAVRSHASDTGRSLKPVKKSAYNWQKND